MRTKRTAQTGLFDPAPVDHPAADALEAMSVRLDADPELLDAIAADLDAKGSSARGRRGLTCETILRCAVLKHLRRETWRGLEFTLRDSQSARGFARAKGTRPPKKSALQATVGAVTADTWEIVNRRLLSAARDAGVETGSRVRVDSTVTRTHILEPADRRLLCDVVRVLARLLGVAREAFGSEAVAYHDHCRAAKRRTLEIQTRRGKERRAGTYRKLRKIADRTRGYVRAALPKVAGAGAAHAS